MSSAELSVIIPSVNSWADLRDCLTALYATADVALEVVVVDRLGPDLRRSVAEAFPQTRVIALAGTATIPEMRNIGINAATGDAIAVIEDHVIVPPDWARRMLDALAEGNDVVGGAIENAATETLIDWASFLCEYSGSLPPLPSGPSMGVPGNNVIYRASVLRRYAGILAQNHWENVLHDRMREDGVELIMRPEIVVGHKMHYTFWLYFSQRYLYSRSFAGGRVRGAPWSRRLIYAAASLALPPVLFYRTVSRIRSKGKHTRELVRSLPLLALFVLSWAAGEFMGYLFGPGTALSRVR